MSKFNRIPKSRLVAVGAVLAVILYLAVNSLSGTLFRSSRLDLTEGGLYSLSSGTEALLGKLDEPIHMRLFMSGSLHQAAPALAAYAARVRAMLDTYESLAHGEITLEVIDPKPYSEEEDRAVGLGINRISLDGTSDPIYFGLAATNSTNGSANIPVFTPDREAFLEYDLTRLVAELGQPKKPVVALLDGLGMAGNPMTGQPPAQILNMLKETYSVETVAGDVDKLPDGTRVVVVVQPQKLSDRTLYTLDQWVLGGGATLVFADPFAETEAGPQPGVPAENNATDFQKMFDAWGVGFDVKKAVGDPDWAIRTVRNIGGRQAEVANYPWFAIHDDGFDRGDAVTSKLNAVVMTTAGAFTATGKDTTLKPLMYASADAGLLPAGEAANPYGDPRALLAKIEKAGGRPVVAARLEGKLRTAFPNGKPDGATADGTPLKESAGAPNVILVGDADMLSDRNWLQKQTVLGREVAQAFANNGDFLLNAVEQMSGGVALADLRSRTVSWRPFTRIDALERAAEERFLAKQQELTQRIADTEKKLKDASATGEAKDGELVSADAAKTIESFKSDLLSARAELREVQYNLRADVATLKNRIMILIIGIVPAAVALIALAFALRRPKRPLPVRKA
ncbi:GldG family protein [Pleomorphomonas koreensis]|uniref:GldG family protein n=1 Tax=Pleomorphomonas koreensis TaxID=257440 RepID=UPI00041FDD3D|nr:GldG family protein [Pleomorphomonas koreensis]